ncbi:hypothetical protein VU01_11754 [Candidatus Electrothrix marina]|uniref:Uncharacterized protein n=1 Tax=Candidatus Electrothrix marina TaxID=1859130 RepID=A0A444JDT3_9BACT|nr:hypothetical protein VT99_10943 [Candidatus Electrothrix marina]RWX51255.1 hypothetical protein VU01_11754 [Candidatus Electrothrix marina]
MCRNIFFFWTRCKSSFCSKKKRGRKLFYNEVGSGEEVGYRTKKQEKKTQVWHWTTPAFSLICSELFSGRRKGMLFFL